LCGGDDALRAACAAALKDLGEVKTDGGNADLLLFVLSEPFDQGVRAFAQIRKERPRVPVIILGSGLSADYAVELVVFGAVDYLSLPLSGAALRRKVERFFTGWNQPAFDVAVLASLRGPEGDPDRSHPDQTPNRRRCFRAFVPRSMAASVLIPISGGEAAMNVVELSVATETSLGGMRLNLQGPEVARLPLASWGIGTELAVRFKLTQEPGPMPGHIRIIRLVFQNGSAGAMVWIGVQYRLQDPRHEEKFHRFWMECQRQPVV
jgi:CheY-like chemotaxis protein